MYQADLDVVEAEVSRWRGRWAILVDDLERMRDDVIAGSRPLSEFVQLARHVLDDFSVGTKGIVDEGFWQPVERRLLLEKANSEELKRMLSVVSSMAQAVAV